MTVSLSLSGEPEKAQKPTQIPLIFNQIFRSNTRRRNHSSKGPFLFIIKYLFLQQKGHLFAVSILFSSWFVQLASPPPHPSRHYEPNKVYKKKVGNEIFKQVQSIKPSICIATQSWIPIMYNNLNYGFFEG